MTTIQQSRCPKCGKRKSKHASACRACEREAREQSLRKARSIVQQGVCPDCGRKLKRNLALAGWWQCEQFGAEGFRADPNQPSCDFQTFTE